LLTSNISVYVSSLYSCYKQP